MAIPRMSGIGRRRSRSQSWRRKPSSPRPAWLWDRNHHAGPSGSIHPAPDPARHRAGRVAKASEGRGAPPRAMNQPRRRPGGRVRRGDQRAEAVVDDQRCRPVVRRCASQGGRMPPLPPNRPMDSPTSGPRAVRTVGRPLRAGEPCGSNAPGSTPTCAPWPTRCRPGWRDPGSMRSTAPESRLDDSAATGSDRHCRQAGSGRSDTGTRVGMAGDGGAVGAALAVCLGALCGPGCCSARAPVSRHRRREPGVALRQGLSSGWASSVPSGWSPGSWSPGPRHRADQASMAACATPSRGSRRAGWSPGRRRS